MAGLAAGGGFLYWKYGDELFSQKQEYRMEDMAGTFTDENAHNGAASAIVLRSDAVSYTHLDVYKRQLKLTVSIVLAF